MDPQRLTKLEKDALELMLGDRNDGLNYQIDFVKVTSRENTGVGIFVNLNVPDQLAILEKARITVSLSGEMDDLENGFGAVLFVEGGKLEMLEFFTFDEPWPDEIRGFKIHHIAG